ncbi:hypothetical protein [Photobacterium sp. OFAV2-7]|uniref:hypothetical protein n=1 Tax=Photobacterium sp. OFAV2-7 TaxID=2917748 RepID=UPI001EF3DCE6|nr:hypothetical protein [Photobacterium sp. OFAV2-7]MCG7587472.1 hypothetical protein [Photobacterium sp. OFAV2-7]
MFLPQVPLLYSVPDLLNLYPVDLSEFMPIQSQTHQSILENDKNHHIAISRFKPQLDSLVAMGVFNEVSVLTKDGVPKVDFIPTYQGLDFYMRCLGYNVYPVEEVLLTLQHWCKLKGVDPFEEGSTT